MSDQKKLGTLLGVFTPTILTILGVIMYLRFGWLVGHLGLLRVLAVVVLANLISAITSLSFSSVATNARVGAGGAYFIISRSLGVEVGGAVGVPLFLSQAFSVTLYAYGLAESFRFVWPDLPLMPVTLGVIAVVGVLSVAGAERVLRAQLFLMALVALSIIVFAAGALSRAEDAAVVLIAPERSVSFWEGFAIFFPAVTGVMAGLGLSGDLKDPGRSIPVGSMAAVLVGFVIYLIIPVLLAVGASPEMLRDDPLVWSRIAVLGPWLVLPGLWAAILSSAIGSVLAAPRTLQALAQDGLAPRPLRHMGRGLAASIAIAFAAALLGNLNAVAAFVSMFFLTVYGTINLVAAFEALSGDPSWRPRLRTPWIVNLIGGIACTVVMVLIDPLVGFLAIVAEISLWAFLSRREQKARWGDARRGLYESLIRWSLINLAKRPQSARNWRPHVLVFVDDPLKELDLIRFGTWFSQGRGVVTACHLVVGDLIKDELGFAEKRQEMQQLLDEEGMVVFAEVDVVRDVVEGIVNVAQANGMAGLTSNTVLLGWPNDPTLRQEVIRVTRRLEPLKKSVVLARINPRHLFRREIKTIHVWWGGIERNSDLMLLLAHLLKCNHDWHNAEVTIMSIASSEMMKTRNEDYLNKLIPDIRIEAKANVLIKEKDRAIADMIQEHSGEAEVVFLGLGIPEPGKEHEYGERLDSLAGSLPVVFFVKNSSMFIGELLESPEEEFEEETPEETPPAPEA